MGKGSGGAQPGFSPITTGSAGETTSMQTPTGATVSQSGFSPAQPSQWGDVQAGSLQTLLSGLQRQQAPQSAAALSPISLGSGGPIVGSMSGGGGGGGKGGAETGSAVGSIIGVVMQVV